MMRALAEPAPNKSTSAVEDRRPRRDVLAWNTPSLIFTLHLPAQGYAAASSPSAQSVAREPHISRQCSLLASSSGSERLSRHPGLAGSFLSFAAAGTASVFYRVSTARPACAICTSCSGVSKLAPIPPMTWLSMMIGRPPCISMKSRAVTAATRPWLMVSSSA
jgi:hypothetical protein